MSRDAKYVTKKISKCCLNSNSTPYIPENVSTSKVVYKEVSTHDMASPRWQTNFSSFPLTWKIQQYDRVTLCNNDDNGYSFHIWERAHTFLDFSKVMNVLLEHYYQRSSKYFLDKIRTQMKTFCCQCTVRTINSNSFNKCHGVTCIYEVPEHLPEKYHTHPIHSFRLYTYNTYPYLPFYAI